MAWSLEGQPVAIDSSLATLLRTFVQDSMNSAGRTPQQVFVASDSSSAAILQAIGIETAHGQSIACPDGSAVRSGVSPTQVGYWIDISLTGGGDLRRLSLSKACVWHSSRGTRGFRESLSVELKRRGSEWSVMRWFDRSIT
jgi:hypothetical protein